MPRPLKSYPLPTTEVPDEATIGAWIFDEEACEATDGCTVEPDGICPDGHPSWLIRLGIH